MPNAQSCWGRVTAAWVGSLAAFVCLGACTTTNVEGGGGDGGIVKATFGCETTGDGCDCSTAIPTNSVACDPRGGVCCKESGWPESGSCACMPAVSYTCAFTASSCRCGPGVTPGAGEGSTGSCSIGSTWKCCLGVGVCNCGPNLQCSSGVNVDTCGGETAPTCKSGTTKIPSCSAVSTPTNPTCADKGFCGPSTDHCACGLACIHLAVGSYTCGESCSTDAECTSKTDPQSGKPYTQCAMATLAGFCS